MAQYKGKNAAIATGVNGAAKLESGEHVGRVRMLYEEIDLTAQALAATDTILVGAKLQAGARVIEAVIAAPVAFGVGTLDLGWSASLTDALDADGFIAAGNVSAAAKIVMPAGAPGLGKKFDSETQVLITANGTIAAGAGKVLKVWLYYVLD